MTRHPQTSPLFPYTTLFRSVPRGERVLRRPAELLIVPLVKARRRQRRDQRYIVIPVRRHRQKKDRKSTRLNSSHSSISYAVFCLKKKKNTRRLICTSRLQIY